MWWSASILMKKASNSVEPRPAPFEENIVLVQAEDEAAPIETAEKIGSEREHQYKSVSRDDIAVRFDRVLAVYQISEEELTTGLTRVT